MISSVLNGGLGNQLFEIAVAYSLAKTLKDECAFDFNVPCVNQGNSPKTYCDTIFAKLKQLPPNQIQWQLLSEQVAKNMLLWDKCDFLLQGYFQSEDWFKVYKDAIIDLFTNSVILSDLSHRFKSILKNSVSVHVRRGDYMNIGEWVGELYYFKALNKLWEKVDTDNILVFSDDIEWCKKHFLYHYNKVHYVEGLRDDEELYLMSLCDHNVCANSSFSWWGSYLNRNPNKLIYMPKPWTTGIGDDIYPKGAIIINR